MFCPPFLLLQVFCYVSRKMAGEGCEKTWDQCRVKLKNLKSQWRWVAVLILVLSAIHPQICERSSSWD